MTPLPNWVNAFDLCLGWWLRGGAWGGAWAASLRFDLGAEGRVSMRADSGREVPEGTRMVAWAAFPKSCLAMRVRDALGPLFDDEIFRSAFGVRGRPGVAPGQ